jgi:outer membrane protein TolC
VSVAALRFFPLVFAGASLVLKNSDSHLYHTSCIIDRMLFLRRYLFWLAAIHAGFAGAFAAEAVKTGGPSSLVDSLPERNLPELDALLKEALVSAPTVLIRRWEAEQSAQNARVSRSPMLPNARASVSAGMILEQRDDGGRKSDRTVEAVLYNVGVSQPVFHWGALSKNYQVAKLTHAISERNVDETRRLLAVDLRRRYFDWVIASGSVTLARKNLDELNRQLAYAKKQVEEGFAASTASGLIVTQITTAEINLQRLENDRDILARNLARLIGVTVDKLPKMVNELPKPPEIDGLVKALSVDAPGESSVRLQNAEDSVRMETLRYQVEKTRLKPKLGMSFSVGQDNRNPDNNALGPKALVTSWNAFATIDWQLFDGFAAKASQRASLARLRSYEQDLEVLAKQETDERRADVSKLQLSWRNLQQAEILFSGAQAGVNAADKDVAAGWVPASEADLLRQSADAALQAVNVARADFYTTLATYFSNRGIDPALQVAAR